MAILIISDNRYSIFTSNLWDYDRILQQIHFTLLGSKSWSMIFHIKTVLKSISDSGFQIICSFTNRMINLQTLKLTYNPLEQNAMQGKEYSCLQLKGMKSFLIQRPDNRPNILNAMRKYTKSKRESSNKGSWLIK